MKKQNAVCTLSFSNTARNMAVVEKVRQALDTIPQPTNCRSSALSLQALRLVPVCPTTCLSASGKLPIIFEHGVKATSIRGGLGQKGIEVKFKSPKEKMSNASPHGMLRSFPRQWQPMAHRRLLIKRCACKFCTNLRASAATEVRAH